MNQLKPPENNYCARTRRNVIRLFWWCLAWVGSSALLAFGPKFLWNKASLLTLVAIALNVGVGIQTILVNKKYLDDLDELQRRVHLNSFAITVGVAIIAAGPYTVMDAYHLIPFHANVSHLVALMGLTYGGCSLYGARRYQ